MITDFLDFIYPLELHLNFACHIVVFFGGVYSAIHSRLLPQWTATCLWYIGLASLFNASTILMEWVFGATFPMSYANLGLLGSIILHVVLAASVAMLFINTLWKDIVFRKIRNH